MQQRSIRTLQGVSLMELMLVLVIAVTLILISVRYYHDYQRDTRISLFERNVSMLFQALNMYYYGHCNKSEVTDVTVGDLVAEGYVAKLPVNPWGEFAVAINNTSNNPQAPFYQLQVIATLQNVHDPIAQHALANLLRGSFNADAGGNTMVMWSRLPVQASDDVVSHQWIMQQGPGEDILPGRGVTAMTAGLSSQLWIMDSGMTLFRLQEQLPAKQYPLISPSACPN